MTERERLKELLLSSDPIKERDLDDDWGDGELDEIVDHLLANGVTAPKVKAGQTVWFPSEYHGGAYPITITHLEIYEEEIILYSEGDSKWLDTDIGKTVFLTREEADDALNERRMI